MTLLMKSEVKSCLLFKLSRRPYIITLAEQVKKISLDFRDYILSNYIMTFIMMNLCSHLQLTAVWKGLQTQAKKRAVKNNLGK